MCDLTLKSQVMSIQGHIFFLNLEQSPQSSSSISLSIELSWSGTVFNWDCNVNKNNIYTHFVFNYTAIYAFHHWEHSNWRGQLLNVKIIHRAGVKYALSNTNTKIWIFQIQIQISCSTLIQIQIHRFKYKYKYVQPNISSETVQIQNRAILWIPRYMLMAWVSLCLGDTWSYPPCISGNSTGTKAVGEREGGVLGCWIGMLSTIRWLEMP